MLQWPSLTFEYNNLNTLPFKNVSNLLSYCQWGFLFVQGRTKFSESLVKMLNICSVCNAARIPWNKYLMWCGEFSLNAAKWGYPHLPKSILINFITTSSRTQSYRIQYASLWHVQSNIYSYTRDQYKCGYGTDLLHQYFDSYSPTTCHTAFTCSSSSIASQSTQAMLLSVLPGDAADATAWRAVTLTQIWWEANFRLTV